MARADRPYDELTPQEQDIVNELTGEAFDQRRAHVYKRHPRYRQMDRLEFWAALCEALRQQKFAHARTPKHDRRAAG